MATSHGIVHGTTRTGTTGTKDFTKTGIGAPKVTIVMGSRNDALNTDINDYMMTFGCTEHAASDNVMVGVSYQDNVDPTDAKTYQDINKLFTTSDPGTDNDDSVATFDSSITDGLRMDWATGQFEASTERRLSLIHLVEGIDEVSVDYVTLNGAGTVTVTPGFQADILIAYHTSSSIEPSQNGCVLSIGFYHRADDLHRCTLWAGSNGASTPQSSCGSDSTMIAGTAALASSSPFNTYQAENFTSTQYDITNIAGSGSPQTMILALKLAAGYSAKVGSFFCPESTGVVSAISGLSFQPQIAFVNASNVIVQDDLTNSDCNISIGACDDDDQVAAGCFIQDHTSGPINSDCQGWHREDACIYLKDDTGTLRVQAIFDSFQSDGLDLNFGTVTGGWDVLVNYLVIGQDPTTSTEILVPTGPIR